MKKLTNKPAMINTPPASKKHVSPMMLRYKAHVRDNLIIIAVVIIVVAVILLVILK